MSLFLSFEGPEGSGKSTQVRLLGDRLAAAGYPLLMCREPGGTAIGEQIRSIVLDLRHPEMVPTAEVLLFAAARAQLVAQAIVPQLERRGIVITDRYADATFAYQGFGLGQKLDELRAITRIATAGVMPALTILIDVPVEVGLARKRRMGNDLSDRALESANQEWNRLDAREIAFHERVRQGYISLAAEEPQRWLVLDGCMSTDVLAAAIWQHVYPRLAVVPMLEQL
ncbi:MAG: dTMP kinase [Herpetosiphon sp.]